MKNFMLLITLFVGSLLANEELRLNALKFGLKPVPYTHLMQKPSKEMLILGKKLFFEKRLSKNADISCYTCHDINNGGMDGLSTAIGDKNQTNPFHLNTPTVLNTMFSKYYFWNARSETLQDQAKGPLQASFEMASTPKLIEKRLRKDREYKDLFKSAFGDENITFNRVASAISAYEHTFTTRSRYDDFLDGNLDALTKEEQDGLRLFMHKGCIGCHKGVGLGGQDIKKFPLLHHPIWTMTDQDNINYIRISFLEYLKDKNVTNKEQRYTSLIQKIGQDNVNLIREGYFEFYDDNESYELMTTIGCYKCHNEKDFSISKEVLKETAFVFKNTGGFLGREKINRFFRVPLLRNIVKTAPYFHNGSVKTLKEAVKIMLTYQSRRKANDAEIESIITFLKAVDAPVNDR